MPYQLLEQHIKKHVEFSGEELKTFCDHFHLKKVMKKQLLLRYGTVCQFEGFVTKGCFRLFTIDHEGNENVLYFAAKDWWVTDIDSFTNQTPAFLSIQALEDSEVLLVNKSDKELLYERMPKVEKLFRIMTQKTLVSLQRRLIRNHSLTAEERYQHFISTYPEIAQKLTNLQIAAYLGITHEFVSKIRKKISKGQ
ncbi:Crp/Fnr family transcriptional regulator [Fulvivirga kasyanovii]|uniref:Crp/Fnr family transcriptional regulator n=2 Tax=Fulvivirga kasyanovii TaxID=396812 RepID=A0ABW9RRK2_9BACT|nr:Crp/Fnr family transcriptional regulator [Fulvivirga kasyanovii]